MCQSEGCVNDIITVYKEVMYIVMYSIAMYHSVSTYHCCSSVLYTIGKYIPYIIPPLLSFQSPHSRSPSHQGQTQQLASPTPSPALLLPWEDSLDPSL